MVMRVTQQSLYGTVISQANSTLLALVETNQQIATEKRIKRLASTLLMKGVDEDTVADIIREFWNIGQTEYGE